MGRRPKRYVMLRNRREAVCPDCIDRGAVNLLGRPIFLGGAKLSGGCATCNGEGRFTEVVDANDYYKHPLIELTKRQLNQRARWEIDDLEYWGPRR